ncbi:MAG: polysaccharide deacetylase family protein, partial [Flavobacteriaceae bacterium]|nr:polysaccharide deacetylase family protein [Flavobacteriaceae bacterium]
MKYYFAKTPIIIQKYFDNYTWKIATDKKEIYLTFDDGPIPEITTWVLQTLAKFNAKATFFCIGDNISKYPDIFKEIINQNHAIGNHTFNHLQGWKTNTY